ncbi:hypothetical protein NW759_016154 [Fusarium solani]|nr:hypothetical protein NW759_016154 [Fusarium solani]
MTKLPKTHRCQRCSRDFARLEHLQRHERSHTKEKPFRCSRCTKAFTRKYEPLFTVHPLGLSIVSRKWLLTMLHRDLLRRHDRLAHQPDDQDPASETITSTTEASSLLLPVTTESPGMDASTIGGLSLQGLMPANSAVAIPSNAPLSAGEFGLENGSFDVEGFLDDFTSFMDSVPVPNHVFSPSYQPLPTLLPDGHDTLTMGDYAETLPETEWPTQSRLHISTSDSNSAESALSRYGSRLPSLQPGDGPLTHPGAPRRPRRKTNDHLSISLEAWQRMLRELDGFSSCVPDDFVLPSKHALSRFLSAYFNVFNEHYPFLHVPTIRVGAMRIELILAIAAIGARYSREPEAGNQLFHLAKDVALERLRTRRGSNAVAVSRDEMSDSDGTSTEDNSGSPSAGDGRHATVETMQALVLLIAIATWFKREPDVFEALSLRTILDSLVREDNQAYERMPQPHNRHEWVRYESLKRTKLVICCFFNIHTIVFDMPPMMLADELRLDLPCAENEWKAASEAEWFRFACSDILAAPEDVASAFEKLFESGPVAAPTETHNKPTPGFSPLGGCVLMHAIIQRIWLVRNSGLPSKHRQQLSSEMMNTFELVLKRWSVSWESGRESSMDPLSPHGPLSFTSTALLRLAYIRINMDLGPIRSLGSWDPDTIARSLDSRLAYCDITC